MQELQEAERPTTDQPRETTGQPQDILPRIRDFARNELLPQQAEFDSLPDLPLPQYEVFQERDLGNWWLPERYGGLGVSLEDSVDLVSELAYGDAGLAFTLFISILGTTTVALYGSEETTGHIPAITGAIVDPTGASDAMTAAIIFGLLEDIPLDESVRLGVNAATLTTPPKGCHGRVLHGRAVAPRSRGDRSREPDPLPSMGRSTPPRWPRRPRRPQRRKGRPPMRRSTPPR